MTTPPTPSPTPSPSPTQHTTPHYIPFRHIQFHEMESIDLSAAIPFFLHAIVEFPAAVNFYCNPSEQLESPAPQAEDIIKQYAVLLFSSSLIALAFATRPVDTTTKYVAGAFALYHLAPTVRAAKRIAGGETGTRYGKGLGGPYVHLAVHSGCLIGFLGLRLNYWASFI